MGHTLWSSWCRRARTRAEQLRAEDHAKEELEVEKLAQRWEPVARGELFPYGAVSVLSPWRKLVELNRRPAGFPNGQAHPNCLGTLASKNMQTREVVIHSFRKCDQSLRSHHRFCFVCDQHF